MKAHVASGAVGPNVVARCSTDGHRHVLVYASAGHATGMETEVLEAIAAHLARADERSELAVEVGRAMARVPNATVGRRWAVSVAIVDVSNGIMIRLLGTVFSVWWDDRWLLRPMGSPSRPIRGDHVLMCDGAALEDTMMLCVSVNSSRAERVIVANVRTVPPDRVDRLIAEFRAHPHPELSVVEASSAFAKLVDLPKSAEVRSLGAISIVGASACGAA